MGNKRKRSKASTSGHREISYVTIIAFIAILFSAAFLIRTVFFPGEVPLKYSGVNPPSSRTDSSIETQVRRISENFRCACGGCGEIQLIECECNMPRGARDEKDFMRRKLKEGLSVNQVIQMVDEQYGYRNT